MATRESCGLEPPSDDTPIWHYSDFAKFVSLLETRALYFSAASGLEDPFEGALPRPDAESGQGPASPEEERRRRSARDLVLISSWHINADESFAMWRLYSSSPEAVAIRTTVGGLKRALAPERRFRIRVSRVDYIDYQRDPLGEAAPSHLAPFLCKAKPYAYENEVRAVIDLVGCEAQPSGREALRDGGVYAQVDLDALLERVYVSPRAGRWFVDLVRGVLRRYEVPREPAQSILSQPPVY